MYEVLKYIHDNIRMQLSVSDIAEEFGYSKWYFCEKFRRLTGKTVTEYIRRYRIQLAALDILSGKKVIDTALNYGYDSAGGFNKAFLTEYGCFPREYRKRAKESQLYYERRKASMFSLSDRCALLRDEAVSAKSYVKNYSAQRIVNFTLGIADVKGKNLSNSEVIASGIANTIEKFRPFIAPGEIIVGYNYADGSFSEYYLPPNDENGRAAMADNGFSDEVTERYFAERDKAFEGYDYGYTVELTKEETEAIREWSGIGRCVCDNHTVINYEKVLLLGFEGLISEIEKYEKINGEKPLYLGAKMICRAACKIGEKYAELADELLKTNAEGYNADDLIQISAVCRRVPRHPAENFAEAVQALLFAHIINTWEDNINANSLGHLDRILYPYYKKDIESGALTKEKAFEIICCLWIKFYRDYDVQQSCLGGTLPNGESTVNDLSYLMLDATEQLDFIRCLSVRFSHNTDKKFLMRALEVVGHVQKGIPFFFNDDVMIPALISKGISEEDAYDYTQLGCVETVIPGKSNPHAVMGETNLLKALEYVFCDGKSMMYPDYEPGLHTGPLDSFTTFDKLYRAVIKQIERILDLTCSSGRKYRDAAVITNPKPYKSLLTDGCLETGRDFNDAGAIYDYYQIMLGGIPNLADSLAVIRKFVYEDKKYTLAEVKEILENNFPDESVRAEFINKAPKFGNDIDSVDSLAFDITDRACDMLDVLSEKYGLSFHAQPFTFLWMINHGYCSAASPDGRRKGEIIAYSVSPMQGRDFSGLTAVLNSISKLPTKKTPGTSSAIVEVDPKLFIDSNISALADILIASGKKGLSNVQFNTIDAETLCKAKKNPEKYNNLAVRVSGFSQKFNLLTPELQDHIIGRTKHTCL